MEVPSHEKSDIFFELLQLLVMDFGQLCVYDYSSEHHASHGALGGAETPRPIRVGKGVPVDPRIHVTHSGYT